jgi:hypothetical protein
MKTLKLLSVILIIAICSCNPTPDSQSGQEAEEWIQLFNGVDLDDWIIKFNTRPLGENYKNTFRVEDGKLAVRYEEYDTFSQEFGHIFYKKPFSSFRLRVEYRIVGAQVKGGKAWAYKNNGVMFHAQSPENMGVNQAFPVSLEAQLLGGSGEEERTTGNLCTPGTHVVMDGELITQHCISSSSPTFHGEEWVTFELVVYSDSIMHHLVNGDTVLTYSKPQIGGGGLPDDFPLKEGIPLKSGYIALQAESHPFEFRTIELLEL